MEYDLRRLDGIVYIARRLNLKVIYLFILVSIGS